MTVETTNMEFVENDIVSDDDAPEEAHSQLLNAVSQLYKKQRIGAPKRREPAQEISEFSLSSNTENKKNRVHINELLKELQEKVTHKEINAKVKAAQKKSRTLPKPLEKNEADKISREIGYQSVCQKLDKWKSIVERNKLADQLVFPLQQKAVEMEVGSNQKTFKEPSELEKAMAAVLNQSEVAQEEKKMEESLSKLSIEEMIERRKMIAKMRARESYRIAKTVRQNKIKSKKYHRILKKERIKQELKDFEKLQKTDPEAALAKLEQIERARAEERISLRHRNTGKWARSRAIRAKYDTEARIQLSEQLAKSRELTRKTNVNDSSDSDGEMIEDDDEGDEPERSLDKSITNPQSGNPWVKETVVDEFLTGYKKFWSEKNKLNQEDKEESSKFEKTIFDRSNENIQTSIDEIPKDAPKVQLDLNAHNNVSAENLLDNSLPNLEPTKIDQSCKTDEVTGNSFNGVVLSADSLQKSTTNSLNPTSNSLPDKNTSETVILNPSIKNTEANNEQLKAKNHNRNGSEISEGGVQRNGYSADILAPDCTKHQADLGAISPTLANIHPRSSLKRKLSLGNNQKELQNEKLPKTRRSPYNKSERLIGLNKGSESTEKFGKDVAGISSKSSPSPKTLRDVGIGPTDPKKSDKSESPLVSKSISTTNSNKLPLNETNIDIIDNSSSSSDMSDNEVEENEDTVASKSGSWSVIIQSGNKKKQKKKFKKKTKAKTLNEIFDDAEEVIQNHTSAFAEKLRKETELVNKAGKVGKIKGNEGHSSMKPFRNTRKNHGLDEALIEIHEEGISSGVNDLKNIKEKLMCAENVDKKEPQIDPNKHINVKPQKLFSEIGNLEEAGNESDEENTQKMDLMEAFADDDIAEEFRKEKDEESKKNKAEEISLELPGWGSWGGTSIPTKSKRKRRRYIVKMPNIPRKDEKKDLVIINEDPVPKLKQQLVNEIPYPFTSVKDFEASIRAPIGKNWVPEKAHKKLVAPPVITKMGTVIEPMSDNVNFGRKKKIKEKLK